MNRSGAAAVNEALAVVSVTLPHLSPLAHTVRVVEDARVETVGVFASGRLLVNPDWFRRLDRGEAMFVIAHELMHLALLTHRRAEGSDARLFNIAHDCIINDMLSHALARPVPAGGLWLVPDARDKSAEEVLAELREDMARYPRFFDDLRSFPPDAVPPAPETAIGEALRRAGLARERRPVDPSGRGTDALPDALEEEWFPAEDPGERAGMRQRARAAAVRAASLRALEGRATEVLRAALAAGDVDPRSRIAAADVTALQTLYRPPWELALQQWVEAVAPGPRSYARPSRRGADRADLVLAGRRREGWILHVVLDTSGSMEGALQRVLGVLAVFCEGANVARVRLVQCDADVTLDEYVDPEALRRFRVEGFGGSDMSPALCALARDLDVEAVVVVTDGAVEYPRDPLPYSVLWVLTRAHPSFRPCYGQVLVLPEDTA